MKRLHQYSRASRFRIAALLRDIRNNNMNETSSSESDDEVRARPRRRVQRNVEAGGPLLERNEDGDNVEEARGPLLERNDDGGNVEGNAEGSSPDSTDDSSHDANISNDEVNAAEGNPNRHEADSEARASSDSNSLQQSDHGEDVDSQNGDGVLHDMQSDHGEDVDSQNGDEVMDDMQSDHGEDVDSQNGDEVVDDMQSDHGEDVDSQNGDEVLGDMHEEDMGWEMDNDVPVYDTAPITLGESMISILSFYLRHNLPCTALSDLLSLIGMHCKPEGNRFPRSLYLFRKFFSNIQFPIIRHHYCSVCFKPVPQGEDVCDEHQNGNDFFIQIPIISQLKALYKRPGFREKLSYKFNRTKFFDGNLEDIYDGAIYRSLSEPGKVLSNPSNISFLWYTDGVSVFKSAKSEIWPFYLVISELPYNERYKLSNAILCGLWFGKSKPAPATFLEPMRQELLRLRQGVNILQGNNPAVNLTVKGIVLGGTGDIPAKANFLNFKAHNATFGCARCTMQSVNIRRGLNVYPFRENLHLRTEDETIRFAQEALHLPVVNGAQQDVFGVKGPTILAAFVYKFVRTTAVDEMHCVFLGLVKSLMALWFEPQHRDKVHSLYRHRESVNSKLSKISPPCFVQRLTRNLDDIKYWKAHELKTFLFYYSLPVFSDIMSELFFDHLKLLVLGLYLLNQRSVSEDNVNLASNLLTEYVAQFEDLYGIDNMTCNLHQLLHLADIVRDFGPLWVTSCFPFEDLNGKLKKLVKGTRHAELQVCSGVSMLMKLSELHHQIPDDSRASLYINALFDPALKIKTTRIKHRMAVVGKMVKKEVLPPIVEEALRNGNVHGRNVYEFYRFMKYCHVFGSEEYSRNIKTKSNCVKYRQGQEFYFGFINRFVRVTNCQCQNLCNGCEADFYAIVRRCNTRFDFKAFDDTVDISFVRTLVDLGDYEAVELTNNLVCMCFVVNISDQDTTYMLEPVNMIEAE